MKDTLQASLFRFLWTDAVEQFMKERAYEGGLAG